jgi:nicotinic acid mononucleotide adenylyltransferase
MFRLVVPMKKTLPESAQLLVLDSSFNPPTKAHLALLKRSQERLPKAQPLLLLSTRNADKMAKDISDRVELIRSLGIPFAVTDQAKFVAKAQVIPKQFENIWWILGSDTVARLFNPIYYDDMDAELEPFFEKNRIICVDRPGAEFYVSGKYKEFVSNSPPLEGPLASISSTKARELLQIYQASSSQSDLEKLKEILPETCLDLILKRKYVF